MENNDCLSTYILLGDTFFDDSEADFKEKVKTALKKCSYKEGPKTMQESVDLEQARGIVVKFGNEKLNKTVTDSTEIISMFKFVGIRSAYKKFQTHEAYVVSSLSTPLFPLCFPGLKL